MHLTSQLKHLDDSAIKSASHHQPLSVTSPIPDYL